MNAQAMSVADYFTEEAEAADRLPAPSIDQCDPPPTHLQRERTYRFLGTTLQRLQLNSARIGMQGGGIKWKGATPVGMVV